MIVAKGVRVPYFLSYPSGAYTLKEIADHFGLHRSGVSRIVRHARCKT